MVGFGINILLLAGLALISIPAMISAEGANAWGAIATGQTIGVVGSIAIMYGWGLTGPAAVARATPQEVLREYRESVKTRFFLLPLVFVPGCVLSFVWGAASPLLSVLGFVSTAVLGLRGNWLFVGKGSPYLLLAYETIPRSIATAVGVVLMVYFDAGAAVGLALQTVGLIAALVATTSWVYSRAGNLDERLPIRPVGDLLKVHRHGVVAGIVGASYGAAPLLIVGVIAPSVVPTFALLARVQSQIYTGASPLLDALQGWVPRAEPELVKKRAWLACAITAAASTLGIGVFSLLGPPLVGALGASTVFAPYAAIVLTAVVIAMSLLAQVTGRSGLVPLGLVKRLTTHTMCGAVTGIAAISFLTALSGLSGALVGMCVGYFVQVVLNVLAIRNSDRPRPRPGNDTTYGRKY
jgi:hypothetical protein